MMRKRARADLKSGSSLSCLSLSSLSHTHTFKGVLVEAVGQVTGVGGWMGNARE